MAQLSVDVGMAGSAAWVSAEQGSPLSPRARSPREARVWATADWNAVDRGGVGDAEGEEQRPSMLLVMYVGPPRV